MATKYSKLRGERLIIAALLMILVAEFIMRIWHLENFGAHEKFHLQYYLAKSFESIGYLLLAVSLITTGIRAIRNKWPNFKGIAMTIIGLILCAIPLLGVLAYKKIGNTLDLPKPHFEQMEAMLKNGNLPLKSKVQLSKMYAHDKYFYEGVAADCLTDSGEKTQYIPTKEDVDFRNLKIKTKRTWDKGSKELPVVTWTWVAIAVISLLLGALTPIQKTTSNMRSDHERA